MIKTNKIEVYLNKRHEDWIIKFPSSYDSKDIGLQEYEYSICAKARGIQMSSTKLFNSKICSGYFGTRRFDRTSDDKKIHVASASGLLETSHRYPNLDYTQLMKLTLLLTQDMQEVKKMFDLMCFNVYAHNRDDHSKNFSFIYCEDENRWLLSPAYDLTYSNSQGGEHATTINYEGKNPQLQDILQVAAIAHAMPKIVLTKLRKLYIRTYVDIYNQLPARFQWDFFESLFLQNKSGFQKESYVHVRVAYQSPDFGELLGLSSEKSA